MLEALRIIKQHLNFPLSPSVGGANSGTQARKDNVMSIKHPGPHQGQDFGIMRSFSLPPSLAEAPVSTPKIDLESLHTGPC